MNIRSKLRFYQLYANKDLKSKCLFLLFTLLLLSVSFTFIHLDTSLKISRKLFEDDVYGEWDEVFYDVGSDTLSLLQNHAFVEEMAISNQYGYFQIDQQIIGTISQWDEHYQELSHLQLLDGRLPQKEDEIVIESYPLKILDLHINDEIQLNETRYKIVGILKDYSSMNQFNQIYLPCAYVNKDSSSDTKTILVKWKYDYKGEDIRLSQGKRADNLKTYQRNAFLNPTFIFLFVIISISISFLLSYTYFEKEQKRFQLFKQLGINRKMLFQYQCYELLSPLLIAFPISFILSLLSYFILPIFEKTSFYPLEFKPNYIACLLFLLLFTLCEMIAIYLADHDMKVKLKSKVKSQVKSFHYLTAKKIGFRMLMARKRLSLSIFFLFVSSQLILCFLSLQLFENKLIYTKSINQYSKIDYKIQPNRKNVAGFTKEELKLLENHPSFSQVGKFYKSDAILSFDDMDSNPYFQVYKKCGKDEVLNMDILIGENRSYFKDLESYVDEGDLNFDIDEVLLVLPELLETEVGCGILSQETSSQIGVRETKLKIGDEIRINLDGKIMKKKIGGIIHHLPDEFYFKYEQPALYLIDEIDTFNVLQIKANENLEPIAYQVLNHFLDHQNIYTLSHYYLQAFQEMEELKSTMLYFITWIVFIIVLEIVISFMMMERWLKDDGNMKIFHLCGMSEKRFNQVYKSNWFYLFGFCCFIIIIIINIYIHSTALFQISAKNDVEKFTKFIIVLSGLSLLFTLLHYMIWLYLVKKKMEEEG